jgi:SAM-dependent methyltransferase
MNIKNSIKQPNEVGQTVQAQYMRAPFPPVSMFPIQKGAPDKRVWLYDYSHIHYHAFGVMPEVAGKRILDAGCGTGHGIVQIRHQAPGADVHACDFCTASLDIARQRIEAMGEESVTFHEADLLNLYNLPGPFDAIFCSGVVHHTANPVGALTQLRKHLKPDGVLYLMLYSQSGRRETMLMQKALKLLTQNSPDQFEGLNVGRMIFDGLPEQNLLARWEREKWGNNHRKHDEAFIDMYVNANEKNYSVKEVFDDLDAAELRFVRFANPHLWSLPERMRTTPDLLHRYEQLSGLEQYELLESLFPDQDQFYFFATHKDYSPSRSPLRESLIDPNTENMELLTARRSPHAKRVQSMDDKSGVELWSGYFGRLARLDAQSVKLLELCDGSMSLQNICSEWQDGAGKQTNADSFNLIKLMEEYGLLLLENYP